MSPEEREKRPPLRRATAVVVSLVVAAVLGGLVGARLGGSDPVGVAERGGAWPPPAGGRSLPAAEVMIELRVWQNVEDPQDTWVQARPQDEHLQTGGPLETDRIAFPLDEDVGSLWLHHFHTFRDLAIAGTELRLWQRYRAPELIYVRVCVTPCLKRDAPGWYAGGWPWEAFHWSPLGMIPLPLDDGHSEFNGARYRYGDLAVSVPVGNPGLAVDREYLLALRAALAGTAELNWSAGTPTSLWEGVRLSGWPPRVTGLDLADRGLDGEIWGWLGDLTELTELRLDGNRLTGTVPSKLALLTKLTQVGLAGNALVGCVPPPLRDADYHDLDRLGLPDCDPPTLLTHDERFPQAMGVERMVRTTGGSYAHRQGGGHYSRRDPETGARLGEWWGPFSFTVVDVPPIAPGQEAEVWVVSNPHTDERDDWLCPPCPFETYLGSTLFREGTWLAVGYGPAASHEWPPPALDGWLVLGLGYPAELGRSHYREDDRAISEMLERIAASAWRTTAIGYDGEWVWP